MRLSKEYKLTLPTLPEEARDVHILPGITHSLLVSIGKLCDTGCEALFDRTSIQIKKEETSYSLANETLCLASGDYHRT